MFTFIYCFDENYNVQAVTSVVSLLENVSEKINILVVHREKDSFKKYLHLIEGHNKLEKLEIKNIKRESLNFPNTKNKHVSEATYYRIYLDKIIEDRNLEKVVYMDSDIICLNNPIKYFNQIYQDLVFYDKPLAARTEELNNVGMEPFDSVFLRNNMKSINYFNAGVLIFNYKLWVENNYFDKLREIQEKYEGELVYWDQDLLNKLFDGNYIELNNFSNFNLGVNWVIPTTVTKDIALLIHYQGSAKPWEISSLHYPSTNLFQGIYSNIFNNKTFLQKSIFSRDIKGLLKLIFYFRIFKVQHPLSALKESFKIIYKEYLLKKL
jgi:lipopolysaccharide biosynthesis glycosyltransferase